MILKQYFENFHGYRFPGQAITQERITRRGKSGEYTGRLKSIPSLRDGLPDTVILKKITETRCVLSFDPYF